MRILLIAPRFHTNQVSFVRKLIEEKHEVGFFVMVHGSCENYKYLTPVTIPISNISQLLLRKQKTNDIARFAANAMPKPIKYLAMVKSFRPDVIIIRGASTPVYAKLLIPFAIIRGVKIVFYTQGPKYVRSINRFRKIHDWVVTKVLKIKWFTPVLYRGINNDNCIDLNYIDYVPFFMYPKAKGDLNRKTPKALHFMCVGKYEPRKNIKLLIEAFEKIILKARNSKLTIIGGCDKIERERYYEECLQLVRTKSLEKNIMLLKNIPYDQVGYYYSISHIIVMPSVNEPASISEMEAMSYGLAVISSSDNGSAHYINNSKNGFIIDVSLNELVNSMMFYITNPEQAIVHGVESLRLINEDLSIKQSYKKLMNVINS